MKLKIYKKMLVLAVFKGFSSWRNDKGYGKSGYDKMNKEEFKVAIAELNRNY
jgi:hypothetical protein